MLVTKILGLASDLPQNSTIDTISIDWFNTQKRIARYTSLGGRDIAFRFEKPLAVGLSHGDIVAKDNDTFIVVSILPVHILTMRVNTNIEIARLCYEIGNYHLPLFFGESEFIFKTPFEKPLQRVLDKLCIQYEEGEGILDSKDRLQVSMMVSEPKLKISQNFHITLNNNKVDRK